MSSGLDLGFSLQCVCIQLVAITNITIGNFTWCDTFSEVHLYKKTGWALLDLVHK